MSNSRTRRKRRQFKQMLKFGPEAKPKHKLKTGRTGSSQHKKAQAARNDRRQASKIRASEKQAQKVGLQTPVFPSVKKLLY